jgi:hypothetical protein
MKVKNWNLIKLNLREWPIPEKLNKHRGFLGLESYYHIFFNNCGEIASPLIS